jgi:hypothetical protein
MERKQTTQIKIFIQSKLESFLLFEKRVNDYLITLQEDKDTMCFGVPSVGYNGLVTILINIIKIAEQ